MPTLLRMPDELYTQELAQVVAPQYAFRTFQDALNGRPFHDPGFRSQVLEFLVRNYRAPAHLIDDAFHALVEDLQQARVLMLERMPMIRAYHWQPGTGEEKGRWVVPIYIFAEHRHMLQLALDNAKSDVPNVGIHEPQEKPTPKVPYRKASSPAPASLKPGADLVDKMAKHSSGEEPLSPEESIQLRKDLGKMNEKLSPGEQFMVPDYSSEEQAYLDNKQLELSNDLGMVYSPAAAALGLPTRAITGDESRVAGAVNTGLAIEGAAGILTIGTNGPARAANTKAGLSKPATESVANRITRSTLNAEDIAQSRPVANKEALIKELIVDSNKKFPLTEINARKMLDELAPPGFTPRTVAGPGGEGADLVFDGPKGKVFKIENKAIESARGFDKALSHAAQSQASGNLVFVQVPEGTNAAQWMSKFWGNRIKADILNPDIPENVTKMNVYKNTEIIIADPNGTILLPRGPIYNP